MGSQNCESTMAPVIGCISNNTAANSSSFWWEATSHRKTSASNWHMQWHTTYKGQVMAKTSTTNYDVAEHLRTPEEMAAYLDACFEEADGDANFIAKALGDIARAKGMTQVARDAGLSRESLYKALSGERSPEFDTVLKVMRALGLRLHAEPMHT